MGRAKFVSSKGLEYNGRTDEMRSVCFFRKESVLLNRRALLRSLGGGACSCFLAERLVAELSCVNDQFGVRTCQAGIDPNKMDTAYAAQERSQWCWAACLEMVFTYWRHPVPQEEIVRRTWGADVNMPAQPYQIVRDLNRAWVDSDGNNFRVAGDVFSANATTAAYDLADDCPLIVGSLGHAMVVTAITYQGMPNPYSAANVVSVTVRDPWPGMGKRFLTPQEYYGSLLLARIRVTSLRSRRGG